VCFGDQGYDGTTTRQIADVAQLTTAAIYHYYRSKSELYREALSQAHTLIYARYSEAIVGCASMVDEFSAVLRCSQELNRADPSLARFLVTSRTDQRRHPELALGDDLPPQRGRFHIDLVQRAVRRGEVRPSDAMTVSDTLRTILGGIVYYASDDAVLQSRVIEGIVRLLEGSLLSGPQHRAEAAGG
jgi:AcrR family transcriptional regulator